MITTRCSCHSEHNCHNGSYSSREDRMIGNVAVLVLLLLLRLHILAAEKRFVPDSRCTAPVISIPCPASQLSQVRFYFDTTTANCSTFEYFPDCLTSDNNFVTWDLCASSCVGAFPVVQPSSVFLISSAKHLTTTTFSNDALIIVASSSYMGILPALTSTPTSSHILRIDFTIRTTISSVIAKTLSIEITPNPISSEDTSNSAISNSFMYDAVAIALGFLVLLVLISLVIVVVVFLRKHKLQMLSQQLSDSYNTRCGHTKNYEGKKEPSV
ncbi:hypothetical protein EMCRGX_G023751 [Ephydatia muelleri]